MRIPTIAALVLLAVAAPVSADESSKDEEEVLSQGWVIPPGEERRFAKGERECLGPAMGARGRRADPGRWETCMEGRRWRRK